MSDEQQQCRECFEVCYPKLDSLEKEIVSLKSETNRLEEANDRLRTGLKEMILIHEAPKDYPCSSSCNACRRERVLSACEAGEGSK